MMQKLQKSEYHGELRKKLFGDHALLVAVAEKALEDETLCEFLVEQTDDPKVIDLMLVNSGKTHVQAIAASKTTNMDLLDQIVSVDSCHSEIVISWLKRTSNQKLICHKFKTSKDIDVMVALFEKITDKDTINETALHHPNRLFRMKAVEKKPDQIVLRDVIIKDVVDKVAYAAISRLTDVEMLSYLDSMIPDGPILGAVKVRLAHLQKAI